MDNLSDTTFNMDQVALILKTAQQLAYDQGKNYAQSKIGDYLERLSQYSCLKPNWEQIAKDIREGNHVYDA